MLEVSHSQVEIKTQIFVNHFPNDWLFRAMIFMIWIFARSFSSPFWVLKIPQKQDLRKKLWNNLWYPSIDNSVVDRCHLCLQADGNILKRKNWKEFRKKYFIFLSKLISLTLSSNTTLKHCHLCVHGITLSSLKFVLWRNDLYASNVMRKNEAFRHLFYH